MLSRWKKFGSPWIRQAIHWLRFAARSLSGARGQWNDPQLLDLVWDSLGIARDNKALVLVGDGTILRINAIALQLCGRPEAQLLGKNVVTCLFEDMPPRTASLVHRWETALKTVDRPVPVEVVREPVARLQGVVVYAVRDLRGRLETAQGEERHAQELQQQKQQLDVALNNMSQGLAMFDSQQRLVICNKLFAEMYRLTPEQVKPGTTVRQILEYRLANGCYTVSDAQNFVNTLVDRFGKLDTALHKLADGRAICVNYRRAMDGGIVVTHEDITERESLSEQLQRQKQHLDVALGHMSQGLCLFDADQRVIIANRRYADMYDLPPDLIEPGTTLRQIMQARARKGFYDNDSAQQWVETGLANFHKEASDVLPLSDGRLVSVQRRLVAGGGVVSTHEDVTEREKLRERLNAALSHMVQGLAMFDAELRLVLANARYAEIYGLEPELVRAGMHLREIIEHRVAKGHYGAKTVDEVIEPILARAAGENASHHVVELPDGRFIAVSVQPMANGGRVTTHHDITEQRRSEAKIAHMARHDTLTGLPNRALLNERLQQALARRGDVVAVHVLDLDRFKLVNDTLGHPVGDKLLQIAADRLRSLVRETDTVARLGGDEFAIVQSGLAQVADATSLAQRVIASLGEPLDIDGHHVVVGTSVGIAMAPSDGDNPGELLRNADLALYRAKSDGRSTFRFFEPDMDAQMQARRVLEQDLRKALAGGQFELHYQPVVDLGSHRISGCEALVRWRHPERGIVSPATFIPLAEEIGLIVPLGEWVIRQACATAARWPGDLKVAVNLSPVQFRSPGLLQVIVGALASSGLPADRLELEITETILLQDSEATLNTLYRLREIGVRIAMDDFGTGYSSLTYLQRFPFDKIKIDRSFVSNIVENASSLNIVRAVAALARGLGVGATAEGVETEAQLDAIKTEGCTEMQGYLFSKPLPAHELEQLILSDQQVRRERTA
jgi:diguanylate cyclase (GGDEF)-like protein